MQCFSDAYPVPAHCNVTSTGYLPSFNEFLIYLGNDQHHLVSDQIETTDNNSQGFFFVVVVVVLLIIFASAAQPALDPVRDQLRAVHR
jgi:hypothetical protein